MAVVVAIAILFINKLIILVLKCLIMGVQMTVYNCSYTQSFDLVQPNHHLKTSRFVNRLRNFGYLPFQLG